MLDEVSLPGAIAEGPGAAAYLLQRHFGGPCLGSARCRGRRALAAALVLGEVMGAFAENFTAQRLPGSIFLSMSWGKEKH